MKVRLYRIVQEHNREREWIVLGESMTDRCAWVEVARFRSGVQAAAYVAEVGERQRDLRDAETRSAS